MHELEEVARVLRRKEMRKVEISLLFGSMKSKRVRSIFALLVIVSLFSIVAFTYASDDQSIIGIAGQDIGVNDEMELHLMCGWGPLEPATSGDGDWCVDSPFDPDWVTKPNCRVIWERDDETCGTLSGYCDLECECLPAKCAIIRIGAKPGDPGAPFPIPSTPTSVILYHLDGPADDSFDVYIWDMHDFSNKLGIYADQYLTWTWVKTTMDIPTNIQSKITCTGYLLLKICATGPKSEDFNHHGQVAFDSIEVYGYLSEFVAPSETYKGRGFLFIEEQKAKGKAKLHIPQDDASPVELEIYDEGAVVASWEWDIVRHQTRTIKCRKGEYTLDIYKCEDSEGRGLNVVINSNKRTLVTAAGRGAFFIGKQN